MPELLDELGGYVGVVNFGDLIILPVYHDVRLA